MHLVAGQHGGGPLDPGDAVSARRIATFVGLVSAGVLAMGCERRMPVDRLELQAAADLRCAESQVRARIEEEGRYRARVRGCAREQSYEIWCALLADGTTRQCEWIREGTSAASRGR